MKTYRCCDDCRVRTHQVWPLGSPMRDDHPHPCIRCANGERGRQEIGDVVKLPMVKVAS